MRARKFLKTGCEGVEGGRKHLSYCLFTPLHPHRCKGVKGVKGARVYVCSAFPVHDVRATVANIIRNEKHGFNDAKVPLYDAKAATLGNTLAPLHPYTLAPLHPWVERVQGCKGARVFECL